MSNRLIAVNLFAMTLGLMIRGDQPELSVVYWALTFLYALMPERQAQGKETP